MQNRESTEVNITPSENIGSDSTTNFGQQSIMQTENSGINEKKDDAFTFNRRALLVLMLILGTALFFMIKMFIVPVILAICFTTLFFPLYSWLLKTFKNNKILSSISCCLILLFGLLIPVYILVHLMATQLISLYMIAEPLIKELIDKGNNSPFTHLFQLPIFESLKSFKIDWQSLLYSGIKTAAHFGTTILNKTSSEIFSLIFTMVITFFTMFYLFIDGEKILQKIQYLSPLHKKYEGLLLKRFLMISRATIRGTILIGLTQGALGALTFLAFGIKSWLLWGFVMLMLSLIPFTGAWMVMMPTAVIQLIFGHYWKAAGITFMCMAVVSSIDNILRPRLVGKDAKMHDLLVFFSTLGGIAVYGVMGFIIGPVIAALFIALLEIYSIEYKSLLSNRNDLN